jgi:hypothetical protein
MNTIGDFLSLWRAMDGPARRVPKGLFMPFPGHRTLGHVNPYPWPRKKSSQRECPTETPDYTEHNVSGA